MTTFTIMFAATETEAAEPCNHATTARTRALDAARVQGRHVSVLRGGRAAYTVSPEGHILPPNGAIADARESCKRALGTDGPCFCSACRAERRERQAS